MAELKPCPFCGGEAAFLGTTCTIKCKQCGGAFIAINPVMTRMETAAAWNRRVNDGKDDSYDSKSNGAMVCLRTNDGFWRKETDFCSYGAEK